MWFEAHNVALDVAQSACVALPAAGLPRRLARFRGRAWALLLPLSIAVVVGVIALVPAAADALAWIAAVLVPVGCALALGWAAHGSRPWLAALALPLFALAWALPSDAPGELAGVVLIAGSAVAAGRLLAGAAPLVFLKVGVVAMAAVDAYLVFSNELQAPNAVLTAAQPALGLPQLQAAAFGGSSLGYGDFFVAAVVGGIVAADRGPQVRVACAVLLATLAWDQLFAFYDVLPATVPPAVVLVGLELWQRVRKSRCRTA